MKLFFQDLNLLQNSSINLITELEYFPIVAIFFKKLPKAKKVFLQLVHHGIGMLTFQSKKDSLTKGTHTFIFPSIKRNICCPAVDNSTYMYEDTFSSLNYQRQKQLYNWQSSVKETSKDADIYVCFGLTLGLCIQTGACLTQTL